MSCPMSPIPMRNPSKLSTHSTPPSSPLSRRPTVTLSALPLNSFTFNATSMRTMTPASPGEALPPGKIAKPKQKLGKGCSLLDWIRLCRKNKDEFCCNGGTPKPITESDLAKHNTKEDAWTAIRGKVYNLTPYMKFHPGGVDDLLKAAGIDCTILFDEVHKWVNVESMLKFCYVGPLVPDSPVTQRRNSFKLAQGAKRRADSLSVGVSKLNVSPNTLRRAATQAATAHEETDGVRQDSPQSPIKLIVPNLARRATLAQDHQEAEESSGSLSIPEPRSRKNSDVAKPCPKFDWVQKERAIILRVFIQHATLKSSDIVIDVNGQDFEASFFINDWVYELKIDLEHTVASSQVFVNGSQVEIALKKKDPQQQWSRIGEFKPGHMSLCLKHTRAPKYHPTTVEAITTVTYDSKLFTLRLSPGSYLNVPTGHHLSVRGSTDGDMVVRSYTPVCSPESFTRHSQADASCSETVELMVKLYKDGKMSRFLSNLNVGDEVWVSDHEGTFDPARLSKATTNLVMVAAGTGFTPMVKVARDFLSAQNSCQSEPQLRHAKLLFANKTEKDILWKEELDHLAKSKQDRFQVIHVLSDTNDSQWEGVKGRINGTLLKSHLPTDKDECNKTLVCICGPCAFTEAISNVLLDLDYPEECIHCFT